MLKTKAFAVFGRADIVLLKLVVLGFTDGFLVASLLLVVRRPSVNESKQMSLQPIRVKGRFMSTKTIERVIVIDVLDHENSYVVQTEEGRVFTLHHSMRRIISVHTDTPRFGRRSTCLVRGKRKYPIRKARIGDKLIVSARSNSWNFQSHYRWANREIQRRKLPRCQRRRVLHEGCLPSMSMGAAAGA